MLNLFLPLLVDSTATTNTPNGGLFGGGSGMFLMLLLMFVIFYFFMIRPQKNRQKKIEEARNSLQKGDKVVTIGGIHGKIVDVKERTFTIEISHDVRIDVDKAAISFNEADLSRKPDSPKEENADKE